jgi:hypothetical protein
VQSIDKHVDVSKIQKAHISKETKDEIIAWKCNKAAEKIIWINCKQFEEIIGIENSLKSFLKDKQDQLLILNNKTATLNYMETHVGFLNKDICRSVAIKNPTVATVGFQMAVNVILNGNDSTFFPSTLLPDIFKTYCKKSDACMALSLYYKATKDFTKAVLNIIEENFYLYMAEADHRRSQDTISRMEMIMIENKIDIKAIREDTATIKASNGRLERQVGTLVENKSDPRFVIIYRHKDWPAKSYKVAGGLKSDRRFQKIVSNTDEYEVVSRFSDINNPAKAKKDVIKSYKDKGTIQSLKIIDGAKTYNTIRMGDNTLRKFIKDLKNTDKAYIPPLESSDDDEGEDEDDLCTLHTANETITTRYLVISRTKVKNVDGYNMYVAVSDEPYKNDDRDYNITQVKVNDGDIVKKIVEAFGLVGDYYDDADDKLTWYATTIKVRTAVAKIVAMAKE